MLRINKKMEYALMSIKFMMDKESASLTSAREIVQQFGAPFDTVSKVLQTMKEGKILDSSKGIKGGYYLISDLSTISYLDLVALIENRNVDDGPCHSDKGPCDHYLNCNIKTPIKIVNQKVTDFLSRVSLKDLLTEDLEKQNTHYTSHSLEEASQL